MLKMTITELRGMIRQLVKEERYGWPVEKEIIPVGDIKNVDTRTNPRDPKNATLSLPKGLNSRSKSIKESFQRISSRELNRWRSGDYTIVEDLEEITQDPCESCGALVDSSELSEVRGRFLCLTCNK